MNQQAANFQNIAESTSAWSRTLQGLIDAGHMQIDQLQRAETVAARTGDPLQHVLVSLGVVEERHLASAMADALGLPLTRAGEFNDYVPHLDDLGLRFLSHAQILPLSADDETIHLVTADPFDTSAADGIGLKLHKAISLSVGLPTEIAAALDRAQEAEPSDSAPRSIGAEADIAQLRDQASEAPVIKLVNQMFRRAVELSASDIHIEPTARGLDVRVRVDGKLMAIAAPPPDKSAAVVSRVKIMAQLNIAEHRLPQDGRIKSTIAGRSIDMRVATLPTMHGEGIVIRLLDRSNLVLDLPGLGFDDDLTDPIKKLIERPNGIVLVTGPTGSGKTTTLYAALGHLISPERKIITVEDPVEYEMSGVTQIQVQSQIGLTFAAGLRAILRQNPDIIMIGEIRDLETAEIAVQAALTGHLVLATLHTNSAVAAIDRLRDMGVPDFLLITTLAGVIAQRLVGSLCPACAVPEDEMLVAQVADGEEGRFRVSPGCDSCAGRGTQGRTAIAEVLSMDEAIRSAVARHADPDELTRLVCDRGMRPMRQHGVSRAAAGEISLREVLRVAAGV